MVASISFSGTECRHADEIFAFPARTEFSVTTTQIPGFEVLVDFDVTIDGEPSLVGQNQRRPHAQTENKEVCL
jgi:hypothetical protein